MKKTFIPQADPQAALLSQKEEIHEAISVVLNQGRYILGENVASFEEQFAAFIGVKHAIGVASGTDAIELCLRAMDIGPGSAVFTVSHTAVATVAAIERAGAVPVLVDITPDTFTMSARSLEEAVKTEISVNKRVPAAVVVVHLYGHPADLEAIAQVSKKYGLKLVEDCAQAHGARYDGRTVGACGDMAAFSFYPTKNLGALGDGGIVTTNNPELAKKSRALREYGWEERYISAAPGINSRLDELQAAILKVRLKALPAENERRRRIAEHYNFMLQDSAAIARPFLSEKSEHVYHQYVIKCHNRKRLQDYLQQRNIGTAIHYPAPVHAQPAYRNRLPLAPDGLKETESICPLILSLPVYPQLQDEDIAYIGNALRAWKG